MIFRVAVLYSLFFPSYEEIMKGLFIIVFLISGLSIYFEKNASFLTNT